jgi:cobalt-zinc-cadmium efflux system outer membrane protein
MVAQLRRMIGDRVFGTHSPKARESVIRLVLLRSALSRCCAAIPSEGDSVVTSTLSVMEILAQVRRAYLARAVRRLRGVPSMVCMPGTGCGSQGTMVDLGAGDHQRLGQPGTVEILPWKTPGKKVGARVVLCLAFCLMAPSGCGRTPGLEVRPEAGSSREESQITRAANAPPTDTSGVQDLLASEPTDQLTLRDALALAFMHNPSLAAFSCETRASEARALQAGLLPNPELDIRVDNIRVSGEPGGFDETQTRLILSQVFEFGNKRQQRQSLAHAQRDAVAWEYEVARVELAATVAGRFAAVLGAQRRVQLLTESLEVAEELHRNVSVQLTEGAMATIGSYQIARRVARVRIWLRRAQCELVAARHRLAATWGSRSPQFAIAIGNLEQMKPIPDSDTVMNLLYENPAMARGDAEITRWQAALALAMAERVPDVTIGAGIRIDHGPDENEFLFDLEIPLPIFDRKQGDMGEARYNLAKARAEKQAAEIAIHEAVAEAFEQLAAAHYEANTLREELLPAVRAECSALRVGFGQGGATLRRLLGVERDLISAEEQYIDALVAYHVMLAVVEGLIGRPLAEMTGQP